MRAVWQMLRRRWWLVALVALLGGYWLLPISGQLIVIPDDRADAHLWPQVRLQPAAPRPGQEATLWVADVVPWPYVLLTVDGEPVPLGLRPQGTEEELLWNWTFTVPKDGTATLRLYHDCHTGCVAWSQIHVGAAPPSAPTTWAPTALGVVFANPSRDWHGRSGWDVELTYARLAEEAGWGIDDLAARVRRARALGLRVLVRVDYAPGQSLPPTDDYLALTEYLAYLRRLARDDRLRGVYGYVLGSGFNGAGSNSVAPDQPVTPEWYARIFNGYGAPVSHTDNAVQVMRAEHPQARVLVGPVQPWTADQGGTRAYEIDVPWLNYMNTLVAALDEGARAKAAAGVALTAPDGFAVQAPGRPGAAEELGHAPAEEPHLDLRRASWDGAQAGFRVYRDWLDVINAYATTRGAPVYVTSTNTFAPDEGVPPAQNYPRGWLTAALEEVNAEPQVLALCWFIDYYPHDTQWQYFDLTRQPGRLVDAAEEFEALLRD